MNNHYYEIDDHKNSSSIVPYVITAGLGLLSWKLYSNPIFRRDFIQGCFNTYDYLYDKYYNLRYDNKIRRTSLLKNQSLENKQKLVDFLYSDDSSIIPESETDSDGSNNSSIVSIVDSSHKYRLIEFFSNELKFESLSYKEKKYYILGTKSNIQEHKDINDKIIDFPWLAASLDIICVDNTASSYEITDKFKNFWIEHNQLPLHIEYYDIWISELISDKQSYPIKENIKEIKLTVIDQKGDFIEYSDVLIEPHRNETKIINIPSLNLKKEEEEEVKEEEVKEEEDKVEEVKVEEVKVEEVKVEEVKVEEVKVEEVKEEEVKEEEVKVEEVKVEEVKEEEVKDEEEEVKEEGVIEENAYDYRYVPFV